jgi:DNA replication initiation complex subunit (GINS family)
MITYQEIYDLLRKEKYSESLQKLPDNLMRDVAAYVEEKKQIIDKQQNNLFSDTIRMTRKQLDNALAILKEIFAIRHKKVLNLAFTAAQTGVSKRDSENLLENEKKLFEITTKQIEDNQKQIIQEMNGVDEEKKEFKNSFIRFKQEVPAFTSSEGTELGPFNPGEVANLDKEIAKILIEDGKAVEIDVE